MVARLTRDNLRALDDLPTLPSVVTRILELVLDDTSSARDAAKIVESDQALSARVLKIVNSPAYGLRQKVSTVNHAIAMLGFTSLKSLVLSVSVYDGMIEGKQAGGLDKIMYWQHCLATGAAARAIAKEVGYDLPEEAFRWYIDLRKCGSMPHAGFGLGVERFVTWICGIDHLRETIAFPRMLYLIYP